MLIRMSLKVDECWNVAMLYQQHISVRTKRSRSCPKSNFDEWREKVTLMSLSDIIN